MAWDVMSGVTKMAWDVRCTTSRRNPFVEHDNSSNTTAGRKKRPSPTLCRFYFYLKYDTWSKKIDQVSDFAFFETCIKIFYLASAITKNPNGLLDC